MKPKHIPAKYTDYTDVTVDEDGDVRMEGASHVIYMDANQARQLAKALKKAARKNEEITA